jgi:peptidoglycan/LPS O-acetylase OafA/YrhL
MQLKRWKETLLLCGIFLVTVLFVAMSELLDMSVLYAHIFAIIQALAGSMLIYLFSVVLSYRTAIMDTRLFKTLERRNFSIYLYHEPLQFLLLWIFSMIGVLPIFNSNLMYLLLCLVRFLSTIAVSALIGWAVDKIKHRVTLK